MCDVSSLSEFANMCVCVSPCVEIIRSKKTEKNLLDSANITTVKLKIQSGVLNQNKNKNGRREIALFIYLQKKSSQQHEWRAATEGEREREKQSIKTQNIQTKNTKNPSVFECCFIFIFVLIVRADVG